MIPVSSLNILLLLKQFLKKYIKSIQKTLYDWLYFFNG